MSAFNRWTPSSWRIPIRHTIICATGPVHHSPLDFWVLTRYDDVATVLRVPLHQGPLVSMVAARGRRVEPPRRISMLDRDRRSRLRSLVSKAFTRRSSRDSGRASDDRGLPHHAGRGRRHDGLSRNSPTRFRQRHLRCWVFRRRSRAIQGWSLDTRVGSSGCPGVEIPKRSGAARHAIGDYMRGLIAERRASPARRLLGVDRRRRGERQAQAETKRSPPVSSAHRRPRDDGQFDRQRHAGALASPRGIASTSRDSRLITSAVEELLRYMVGTAHGASRTPRSRSVGRSPRARW